MKRIGWITFESLCSLEQGGNNKGAVPIHLNKSHVANTPVYIVDDELVDNDLDRLRAEIVRLKDLLVSKCDHDWLYDGHGHNYDVYKCTKCKETRNV